MTPSRHHCALLLTALTLSNALPAQLASRAEASPVAEPHDDTNALIELIDAINNALSTDGKFDLSDNQSIVDILDSSHLAGTRLATRCLTVDSPQASASFTQRPARSVHPLDLEDPSLVRVRREWVTDLYRFAASTQAYRKNELQAFQRACIEAELGRVTALLLGGTESGIELSEQYFQQAFRHHQSLRHHPAVSSALHITTLDSRITVSLLYLASEDSKLMFQGFLELYADDPHDGVDTPQGSTHVLIENLRGQLGLPDTLEAIDHADLPADLKTKLHQVAKTQHGHQIEP